MLPVLLRLPLFGRLVDLHAYGVLVALGLAAGTVLAVREARLRGVDPLLVRNLCLWVIVWSLVGARLFALAAGALDAGPGPWPLENCLDALANAGGPRAAVACLRPLLPWGGGLVFYGGVLAGLLTIAWFTRRHAMPLAATMDLLTPSVPAAHVFGRLGCFFAGCCWGRPSSLPWALSFPGASAAFREMAAHGEIGAAHAARTPPLHPTQLYEAAGELGLFALVMALRRRTRFGGELALGWLSGYSALRLVVELFRGDAAREYLVALDTPALNRWLGLPPSVPALLSTSQGVALVLLAASGSLLVAGARRAARARIRKAEEARAPAPPPPPRG